MTQSSKIGKKKNLNNEKVRIQWIDVAKFFGIFFIYLGHMNMDRSHHFVYYFHVPLFFFLSGCMETLNQEEKFIKYFMKKVKNILIPFFVFALLSIIIRAIEIDASASEVKNMLFLLLKGNIKDTTMFAVSLWFLSCLFIMEVLFYIIKKVKLKPIILLVCLGLFIIANAIIYPSPIVTPHFIYNIDSAFYYIIYYSIGYIIFPYIQNLFKFNKTKNQMIVSISGIMVFLYSVLLFFGKDSLNLVERITPECMHMFLPIVRALLVVYLFLVISKILEEKEFLNEIGKKTLYLCGGEYIVKTLILYSFSIIGLKVEITNQVASYIYTFVLLVLSSKYLVPIFKHLIDKIQELFSKLFPSHT